MLTIIPPDQFKQIPWKNGKGTTTELAISENSSLDNFKWRLSIASVVADGEFSDFSGYWRNLVLLSGNGISLQHSLHNEAHIDKLTQLLQVSSFDGSSKTHGKLLGDHSNNDNKCAITDFNLMTKIGEYHSEVSTYSTHEQIKIKPCDLCFVYSITDRLIIKSTETAATQNLSAKHLLKITSPTVNALTLSGKMTIVIYLFKIAD